MHSALGSIILYGTDPGQFKEQECVSGIYVANSFTSDLSLQTTTAHGSLALETWHYSFQCQSFKRIVRALTHVLPLIENPDKCSNMSIFTSVVS